MTISKEKTPWGRGSNHRARSGKKDTYNKPDYDLYRTLKARINASDLTGEEYESALQQAVLRSGV